MQIVNMNMQILHAEKEDSANITDMVWRILINERHAYGVWLEKAQGERSFLQI